VSDSTGETLTTIAKAAAVQYADARAIEHVYPLIRNKRQIDRVLQEIESAPGIVLYTIVNKELTAQLEKRCRELGAPCLYVLESSTCWTRSTSGVSMLSTSRWCTTTESCRMT
jgi:regulator of PEP synthase PpsR (kinase-PPPase family)